MTGKTAVLIPLWSRDGASAYDAALIVESAIKCRSVDEVNRLASLWKLSFR